MITVENDIYLEMKDEKLNIKLSESNEWDWTDDFQWTTDMLYSMLENCNEIRVSNYSLKMDSAYKAMGGPVVYTLTRCKEWWDRFSAIELDDSGRGPAEWYDDYDEGRIGLISAYGTKNKNIRDIDWEDVYSHEGWTISQEPYQIVNSLNGKGSELFILLDDKGRPVYNLIPKEHRERIKTNWEDRFYGKNINESDEWDWAKETKLNPLESEYYIIDNRSHILHLDDRHENDWVLMRIIDKYPNGDVKYKVIESNLDPESNWGLSVRCTESSVSGEWLKNLLGMDSNLPKSEKEPYWIPHDGDTSNLPKSEKYVNCEELNKSKNISEGDELDWIKNTEVDTIKVGAIFKDTEDERLVITNIDPESSSMTIKSLDFTGEGEDHTLKKNWEIEEWLDLIHSGDIRWVGSQEMNESDDFDWVREVPNDLPKDRPWVLVNDVDFESEEVSKDIQNFLFGKQGFKWISGNRDIYNKPFLAFQNHFGDGSRSGIGYHDRVGEYYRNSSSEEKKQEYEERLRKFRKEFGDDVYFWSDIGSSQINESDDFDWIRTTVPTVSIGGKNDYPIEDVPLGTKVITPEGNVFTIEDIAGGHMGFQHVWGRDLKPAWLGPKNYVDNRNWHNALFLRKVDDSINESNEFDWVESALDKPINFIPGDEIKVINVGREDAFIKYLGVYGRPYRLGAFGPNITGVVTEREGFNSRGNFFLEVKRMYNGEEKFERIVFPYPEEINRLRSRNNKDYKDLDIQYEYLGNKSIKEVEQMYYKPLYGKTSNGDFQKEEDGTYKVWWIEPTDDDKPLLGENTKHSLCTYSNGEKILHPIKDDTHLKNILNGKQLVQQKHLKDIK